MVLHVERLSNNFVGDHLMNSVITSISTLESLFGKGCYQRDKDFCDDPEKVSWYINLKDEHGKICIWLRASSSNKYINNRFSTWYENEKTFEHLKQLINDTP